VIVRRTAEIRDALIDHEPDYGQPQIGCPDAPRAGTRSGPLQSVSSAVEPAVRLRQPEVVAQRDTTVAGTKKTAAAQLRHYEFGEIL
jgi:hypothetical protein